MELENVAAPANQQPERRLQSDREMEAILRLVDELPEEQRTVFLLREEAGMDLDEIAAVTGVNAETAKSRLRYAVRKLRAGLGDGHE
jgi:RNA polymerase sigma-70 factor (ECF subfamily)